MEPSGSVSTWIEQLRQGNDDVAVRLWQRYYARLVGLARRKLGDRPRRATDEEDVASDAFERFIRGAKAGKFPVLSDRKNLWPLLVKITERRAYSQLRSENRQKRGGGRLRGDSAIVSDRAFCGDAFDQLPSQEPTPEFAVELADNLASLLLELDDELKQIAVLKLSGETNHTIATEIGRSLPTVERRLRRIRSQWQGKLEQ